MTRGEGTAPPADYPPQVLRDYAFLGDGHRGGLIGPRGDVGWLCAPGWDGPPAFSRLVGGEGVYAVTPVEPFVWGGYYEPGSLVWRSRWTMAGARVECREALACPSDPHRVVLLRRVDAVDGASRVEVVLQVAAGFDRRALELRRDDDGCWVLDTPPRRVRWSGGGEARLDRDGLLRLSVDLAPGGRHDLVLEISDRALPAPPDAERLWQATEAYWADSVPGFDSSVAPRDSRHAYAVLRGLTTPGGGMVAAATLGMPERAEAGRNFDYRYVWLRDQAYAGLAVGVDHPDPLLDEAVALSTARVLEHGPDLAPAYRADGRLPPREEHIDLPGYPGGRVVTGNWVRGQFQLDLCGELLQLYATSGRHDHLTSDDVRAVAQVVDLVDHRWDEPDAGVWELDDAWWTHSRLSCVAGLRTVAREVPAATPRGRSPSPTRSWPRRRAGPSPRTAPGAGLPESTASTPRSCCHRCGEPCPRTIPVASPPCTPCPGTWSRTATSTATRPATGRSVMPRGRSSCAGSPCPWPSWPSATRSRRSAGSSDSGPRAARPACSPRSSTSASASSAGTCHRGSSTPSCWSARNVWRARATG